jgi:hypothetical protein
LCGGHFKSFQISFRISFCAVCSLSPDNIRPNASKYTCPRCNAPYCSSACFALHSTDCTEKFFKREVEGELLLRAKEDKGDDETRLNTVLALARDSGGLTSTGVSSSEDADQEHGDNIDDVSSDEDEATNKRRDELQIAADCISTSENQGKTSFSTNTVETILGGSEIISAVRKAALEQNLSYALWVPWWKQTSIQHSLAIAHAQSKEDTSLQSDVFSTSSKDDPSLRPPPCQLLSKHTSMNSIHSLDELLQSRKKPSSLLMYNLLDLLVAYVHTTRLYNGDHLSCIPDSAGILLATSSVLREDARHHNSISSLSTAIESTHAPEIRRTDHPDLRTALETIEDVLLILKDPHFVVDALVDARDIVEGAVKAASMTQKQEKRALETVSKKLYFFIVWANDNLVRSDAVGESRRFDSEFDRIAAGVESGAAICARLREDTMTYLESQVEMLRTDRKIKSFQ